MTGITSIDNLLKIPTTSFIRADQEFIEVHANLPASQYAEWYKEISGGFELDQTDDKKAEIKLRYLIQKFIKEPILTAEEVVEAAARQYNAFMEKNGYLYENRVNEQPMIREVKKTDGSTVIRVRRQDGRSKSEVAEEVYMANRTKDLDRKGWIALLVEEVGLTPGGASTYFCNLQKKHGDVVKKKGKK
jgi:hypothetical protein